MQEPIQLPKISQSLIKAFYDYVQEKECGIYFDERYIKKNPKTEKEPTDAMMLGIYFEYLCLGTIPRNGIIPEPQYSYKGTAREKLAEPYLRAQQGAETFKAVMQHYGIKIVKTNYYLETKDRENGLLDAIIEFNGEQAILDLKRSGLINDKWSELGWEMESLPMKDSIMIQPVHYKLLARKELKIEDMPFYFYVADEKDPNNARFIRVEVDESKMQAHEVLINNLKGRLIAEMKKGFTPLPDLERCNKCPLRDECAYATKVPIVQEVYYG